MLGVGRSVTGKAWRPRDCDERTAMALAQKLEMPEIVPIFVEVEEQAGPFGAKGIAEPAQVPTAPAIQDALYDAVGIRLQTTPFTPKKVLQAIERRGRRARKTESPVSSGGGTNGKGA